jgi:hypothetical protein
MHSLPAAYPQQTGQQKQANILILNEKKCFAHKQKRV